MPFRKILNFLKGKTLLEEAREDALEMLIETKYMFLEVNKMLFEKADIDFDVYTLDKKVNKSEIEIREKILRHLSFGANKYDIVPSLVLTSIVIDIERIGDYCKNVFELVEMYPEKLDENSYIKKLKEVSQEIEYEFDVTYVAFKEGDPEKARIVLEKHEKLNRILKKILEEISREDSGLSVKMGIIAALLSRYLKRVSAHLKNIASSIVNPFPKIGYQPESEF